MNLKIKKTEGLRDNSPRTFPKPPFVCSVSGVIWLVTEARHPRWYHADKRPYTGVCIGGKGEFGELSSWNEGDPMDANTHIIDYPVTIHLTPSSP